MADHIYLAEKCKREFKSVVSGFSGWRRWRSLDPQYRFFTICMKGVATKEPGKLGSDFAAEQGGDIHALGDHTQSLDSRILGPISREDIARIIHEEIVKLNNILYFNFL